MAGGPVMLENPLCHPATSFSIRHNAWPKEGGVKDLQQLAVAGQIHQVTIGSHGERLEAARGPFLLHHVVAERLLDCEVIHPWHMVHLP